VFSLVLFGAEDFLIPSMIIIIALLSIFRKPIESGYAEVTELKGGGV
jgi:hypothetical protein